MPDIQNAPVPDKKPERPDRYPALVKLLKRSGINIGFRTMSSDNFVEGISGWRLGADGTISYVGQISGLTADYLLLVNVPTTFDPTAHKTSHENGGADEINVNGLSGTLADPQPTGAPTAHKTSHQNGGSDELNVGGLNGELADPQPPKTHGTAHENGGPDEFSVAGLSGTLADPQTPTAHISSHEPTGADPFLGIHKLATVTAIDGTAIATTNLYTVPGGKKAVITMAVVRVTASNTATVELAAGVGVAAGEDDIFPSVTLTGLLSVDEAFAFLPTGTYIIADAAAIIKLGIDTGATATTLTLSVDLFGYLL